MKRVLLAAPVVLLALGGACQGGALPVPAPAIRTLAPVAPAPGPVSAPVPTPAQAAPPDAALWQSILQRLGSDDFGERAGAQKELDKITWHQIDFLRQAADAAGDPEVQGRLAARVAAIEEELAADPPGLTLALKDATVQEVADALGKALGVKMDVWPPNGSGQNLRYTLNAKEKPFWEVFMALSRQHGLSLQDFGNGQLRLMAQAGQEWQNGVIAGPVAIFPQTITRQRTVNLQADKGQQLNPESMNFFYQVAMDPRVRLVKYSNPTFTSIVDDAGNMLAEQPPIAPGNMWDVNGRMSVQGMSIGLQMFPKKGTRIVSAKGMVHYAVQTGEDHVEIAGIEKKEGQTFEVGGYGVQLSSFKAQGNGNNVTVNLMVQVVRTPAADNNGAARNFNGMNNMPVFMTFLDSSGQTIYSSALRGGLGAGFGGNYSAPYKLRLSVATKIKEVSLPFELKDLALP